MNLTTAESSTGATVVALHGEMDMYSSHELKEFVSEHFSRRASALIVDCENLSYIDSSGVGILLFTFAQSKKIGTRVWFVNIHGAVRRVIELTSLLGFLPIVDSVAEAEALLA